MSRLLRDLIDIPETVHKGDLVFRLVDANDDPAQTVADYVVTAQLTKSFIAAVKLIESAIDDNASKADYLDGSFGSGKSNFMGVLQLLLDGNADARAVPELSPVVDALDRWKGERRFLTVPFHLIGSDDLESAVFGQYVKHMAHLEPGAPPPAVYADEPILENADGLRENMGDEIFFATLSEAAGADSGWGDLSGAWSASTYDAARGAPRGSADRIRLVQALLATLLTSFADVARANRGGYVSFEDGLAAISQHAKSLGYDCVILFLDELILWFLSRLGDTAWVNEEASKLAELVEAASASRPVPIVSLVARQRDLRNLVGDSVPGAEKLSFADQLAYLESRFGTIKLDDSNLPMVAHRRLLMPKNDAAEAELKAAFESLSLSQRTHDALLAENGDDASFALTYPFSPAFMTVLVDVAGALQRTRTGLRVLLDLLVAGRDTLEVGHLVPVGDLYDVIDASDEPFSDAMRAAFDQARRIYTERLQPALLAEHHLHPGDDTTTAFANDDRLIKTLLLAALVPQSVPFKDLTVERLVALNHGTISSPVPGQETNIATNKLRRLMSLAGELRVGSDANNPTVSIVLTDVDTESILATADGADNTANRRTLVRQIVLSALALPTDQMQTTYRILWKGLMRDVAVVFGNLRNPDDLPDPAFANEGPGWKLLVDFPFDDPGYSPMEDLARIEGFRQNGANWSTLCWLPSFFTATTLDILGRLVRLNHVLANEDRYAEATASLSPVARGSAKPQLQAMQTAARSRLDAALLGAYGVAGADEQVVDRSHSLADHFPSLRAGLTIRPPTTPTLEGALDQVLDQALRHSFPGAPDLESEVKPADVRKVAQLCSDAVIEPDGRLVVNDSVDRKLLARAANPLHLGIQSEQAFKVEAVAGYWDNIFNRAIGRARAEGAPTATVGLLRRAVDEPDERGLSRAIENLVILVWAQATSHTFREHGGPATATVDRLDDGWEVVAQELPSDTVWTAATERLPLVFGVQLPTSHRSGFSVERAGKALADQAAKHRHAVERLVDGLRRRAAEIGMDETNFQRLRTADCAMDLLGAIDSASDDLGRVEAFAAATITPSPLALGRSISSAADVSARLDATQFDIISAALTHPEGHPLRVQLTSALAADEFVSPLGPVLESVQQQAISILTPDPGPEPPVPAPAGGRRSWTGQSAVEARTKLDQVQAKPDLFVTIEWTETE